MNEIYLDYSATTPVDSDVLDYYVRITNQYIGNPNSIHDLGIKSKKLLKSCLDNIANILNCSPSELTFTSGASESNSTIIRGVASYYKNIGRHIITSKLEHKSILDEMNRLEKEGYFISYVKIKENGLIDLDDLKKLITDKTILVSICGVNSETGFKQDLQAIRQAINSINSKIVFHSDLTQALGKIKIDLSSVDLASFSSHKIYAPKGCGLIYKKMNINFDNLIGGTTNNSPLRGGTPALPLIASFSYAMSKINQNIYDNYKKVEYLNKILINGLKKYPVQINSNENSIPHIVNFSLIKEDSVAFLKKLSSKGIYISTRSACSSLNESQVLNAIYDNNKSISKTSLRVSISYLTTVDEIEEFLNVFDELYK